MPMVLHGPIEPCIELARKNVTIILCEPMELPRGKEMCQGSCMS